jgi:hypothetical protein
MNRKLVIILSVLFAAVLGSLAVVGVCPRFKKIEKRGPIPESVQAVLPNDVSTTASAIRKTFNNWLAFDRPDQIGSYQSKFPDGIQWSHFFLLLKTDAQHSLFPSDEEILLDRGVDSFVERYVRVPAQLRNRDLYLYEPTGDYYWESEYFYEGRPAKFRCSFIIHLEPAANISTNVEIFEYQPTIWAGEYLGLSADGPLPAMLHDIRSVEETTTDRKAILTMIIKAYTLQK